MSYKEELSKKRKELARHYVESEEVNEPVLWELHRLMRPIYYYCLRRYFEDKIRFADHLQELQVFRTTRVHRETGKTTGF